MISMQIYGHLSSTGITTIYGKSELIPAVYVSYLCSDLTHIWGNQAVLYLYLVTYILDHLLLESFPFYSTHSVTTDSLLDSTWQNMTLRNNPTFILISSYWVLNEVRSCEEYCRCDNHYRHILSFWFQHWTMAVMVSFCASGVRIGNCALLLLMQSPEWLHHSGCSHCKLL